MIIANTNNTDHKSNVADKQRETKSRSSRALKSFARITHANCITCVRHKPKREQNQSPRALGPKTRLVAMRPSRLQSRCVHANDRDVSFVRTFGQALRDPRQRTSRVLNQSNQRATDGGGLVLLVVSGVSRNACRSTRTRAEMSQNTHTHTHTRAHTRISPNVESRPHFN